MRKIKILSLLLSSIMLCGCMSSCGENSQGNTLSPEIKAGEISSEYVAEDTDYKLVDNRASDYVIVYPVIDGVEKCKEASDILYSYVKQSTDAELRVRSDKNYVPQANDKIISLGNTSIAEERGITASAIELGEDGYYLLTSEDDLFIQGCTDNAVLFGVYDFLTYQFGIKFYSYDEIKIPEAATVYLKNFDLKSVPAFANRCLDLNYFNPNSFNSTYEKMMKLNSGHGRGWITWAHTHFSLMPKSVYLKDHSDYYSYPDQSQLCLTNDDMIAELCENIKKRLAKETLTNAEYNFMIGQEDAQTFCDCDDCKAEKVRLGSESGVMMQFINKVADIMNPYVEETYPGKKIYWVTFAYHKTETPPVKKNADGSFSPYHKDVVAHENVGVLYAPIFFDHYHDVDDKKYNNLLMDEMQGWKATDATMFIWTYAAVYYSGFCFFDDYHTVKDAYKAFKDMGAAYLFTETDWRIGDPFHALSFYVRAKLMWNIDGDVNSMINEFIDEYYKAGATQLKKYFNALRANYRRIEAEYTAAGKEFSLLVLETDGYTRKDYWKKPWLTDMMSLLDDALAEVAKMEDKEVKEKVRKRIQLEKTSLIFHMMQIYSGELSNAEIVGYITDFERYAAEGNLVRFKQRQEVQTVEALLNSWRTLVP